MEMHLYEGGQIVVYNERGERVDPEGWASIPEDLRVFVHRNGHVVETSREELVAKGRGKVGFV